MGDMRHCTGWRFFVFCFSVLFVLFHLFSAFNLHQEAAIDDPRKKQNKKFDHLVLGPAAGQGLPNRLQCQGITALNKTHLHNYSVSSLRNGVAFVTLFAIHNASSDKAVDGRSMNLVTVANVSYNKQEMSIAVLNVFINFIQVSMPRSNVIIITDPTSGFSLARDGVTVHSIEGDYSRERLMFQRIQSYISFLETRLERIAGNPGNVVDYIFTDSDVAVVGDLGHIFQQHPNFHVALTFRSNKHQPINSGFIAIRGTYHALLRGRSFLKDVRNVYSTVYKNASRVLGDQMALAHVARSRLGLDSWRFARAEAFQQRINGVLVLFLPCSIYNWTPPEGAGQFHGMPLDVKVVHFKGSRKRLMLESWNRFSSSSDLHDMLCLVLMSGRTKYDF